MEVERRLSPLRPQFDSACAMIAEAVMRGDIPAARSAIQSFAQFARGADIPIERAVAGIKRCLREPRDAHARRGYYASIHYALGWVLDEYYG